MSSLDKSSFVLGNELWEEHFESLLARFMSYVSLIQRRKRRREGEDEEFWENRHFLFNPFPMHEFTCFFGQWCNLMS